jgi:hypothetical protein
MRPASSSGIAEAPGDAVILRDGRFEGGQSLLERGNPGLDEGARRCHLAQSPCDPLILDRRAELVQFEGGPQRFEVDAFGRQAEAPDRFDQALDRRVQALAGHRYGLG